jgi:hypothetical protein
MKNLKMFCLTLNKDHLNKIKKLEYTPVGLGDDYFSDEWMSDKNGLNIANKNPYYGEYTFHYWLWKNYLNKIKTKWVGFCQYRKFWTEEEIVTKNPTLQLLSEKVIKNIPEKYHEYESIIGNPFFVNQFRFSKFIKRNFKKMILNPSLIFKKKKRTIKFHFDMWHGEGNIDKAIEYLDNQNREDFKHYIETNTSFNPHNMFICKTEILSKYYESIFPWLEKCEKEFGFKNLKGFGLKRIYGFLAERYLSYWFRKYTKYKTMPIYFKDVSDLNL